MRLRFKYVAALFLGMAVSAAWGQTAPLGEIRGTAWVHTPASLAAGLANADVVLPARATGGAAFFGKFRDLPKTRGERVPVVIFLHGSSGLGLKAIGEWQRLLADQGYASVAPDSFALPDRVTYKSPIGKAEYERIHALRAAEIPPALDAVLAAPWADAERLVLAGTSEGAVAVARFPGKAFAARIVFAWSCEANYFVEEPRNAFEPGKPVLNLTSAVDPFFSARNPYLGNAAASGHCGAALKDNAAAAVVLIPDAPHTVLMLPAARAAALGFLREVLGR